MRSRRSGRCLAVALLSLFTSVAAAGCGSVDNGDGPTISITVSGSGSVTSVPAGINCGSDCSAAFEAGSSVTLSAAAASGAAFAGWSGGTCSGSGDCTLVASENVAVQAMFAAANTVSVSVTGTGTGTVTSTPPGINCPPTCSTGFAAGQTITLSATPSPATAFAGWTGACTGTAACTAATSTAVNVTATFTRALACSTVANGSTCSTVARPEINRGMITATACHDQCQIAMAVAGMTTGCWIIALNGNCYCRDGVLATGSTLPGGICTVN